MHGHNTSRLGVGSTVSRTKGQQRQSRIWESRVDAGEDENIIYWLIQWPTFVHLHPGLGTFTTYIERFTSSCWTWYDRNLICVPPFKSFGLPLQKASQTIVSNGWRFFGSGSPGHVPYSIK
jgi:hypothetical protein